jgi:hypothetical protein
VLLLLKMLDKTVVAAAVAGGDDVFVAVPSVNLGISHSSHTLNSG